MVIRWGCRKRGGSSAALLNPYQKSGTWRSRLIIFRRFSTTSHPLSETVSDRAHGTRGAISSRSPPSMWRAVSTWRALTASWRWAHRSSFTRTLSRTLQFIHTSSVGFFAQCERLCTHSQLGDARWPVSPSVWKCELVAALKLNDKFHLPSLAGFWHLIMLDVSACYVYISTEIQSRCRARSLWNISSWKHSSQTHASKTALLNVGTCFKSY